MSNQLPITIQMGALPPQVKWTPQQLADAIALRMRLVTSQTFALFVTGSTAPTSDVGPWLKNGSEWWVWDTGSGAYVPITINQESLGYYIGNAAPDPTLYQFWIETNGGGVPVALKIYSGGAWTDVYAVTLALYQTVAGMAAYSTTAQMTAAIAAAVGAIPTSSVGQGAFSATPTAQQDLVFGAPGTLTGQVLLGTEVFDPDAAFAASVFTVPATGYYQFNWQVAVAMSGGVPSEVDMWFKLDVNGSDRAWANHIDGPYTRTGGRFVGSAFVYLNQNDLVSLTYEVVVDAAVTVSIFAGDTNLSGYRVR